jgi:hypothetical protein
VLGKCLNMHSMACDCCGTGHIACSSSMSAKGSLLTNNFYRTCQTERSCY